MKMMSGFHASSFSLSTNKWPLGEIVLARFFAPNPFQRSESGIRALNSLDSFVSNGSYVNSRFIGFRDLLVFSFAGLCERFRRMRLRLPLSVPP